MKLLFKQRFFSWFDSYDIYDENQNVVYVIKGQLSWGHCLKIFNASGREVGTVKERVLTSAAGGFGQLYSAIDELRQAVRRRWKTEPDIGISKEFSFVKPRYNIDFNGWQVEGSFLEWDYSIIGSTGQEIATVSKELFRMTDTYVLDIVNPRDALPVLMFVLAIDAEKCSRNQH
mgnify:CR=1 FL=1